MEIIKSFSRRSFIMIMLFMSVLLLISDLAYDFGIDFISAKVAVIVGADVSSIVTGSISVVQSDFKLPFILILSGVLLLTGMLVWFVLRLSIGQMMGKFSQKKTDKKIVKQEKPTISKHEKLESDRRVYLHLLSVLQREGRLVDFFSEDLGMYEDAQIGAAVRNIHENCKKTIDKYLKPVAVIDQVEGDEITIEQNFDPNAIKLIGNVSGEPPFKGVLRHKGWKVTKSELPKLSGKKDSKLISPAEVEIS